MILSENRYPLFGIMLQKQKTPDVSGGGLVVGLRFASAHAQSPRPRQVAARTVGFAAGESVHGADQCRLRERLSI